MNAKEKFGLILGILSTALAIVGAYNVGDLSQTLTQTQSNGFVMIVVGLGLGSFGFGYAGGAEEDNKKEE